MTTALNRRWFRCSLRSLFIAMAVGGGCLGWLGWNVRRVQERHQAVYSGRLTMAGIGTYEFNPGCRKLPYVWRWLGATPYYFVELPSDATPTEIARWKALFPDARVEIQ